MQETIFAPYKVDPAVHAHPLNTYLTPIKLVSLKTVCHVKPNSTNCFLHG